MRESEAKVDFADCLGIKALGSKVWLRDYEGSRGNLGRIFTFIPLSWFEEDNYLYGELPGLGSHLFVHVCTAPTTGEPLLLAWESLGLLHCALSMLRKESIPLTEKEESSPAPLPLWGILCGFLIPSRPVSLILSCQGGLELPSGDVFLCFCLGQRPARESLTGATSDSVSVGCWPCQSSDQAKF